MKTRFLLVLVLIAAGILGLGFYRGWFQFTSVGSADKTTVTVTVDKDKIKEDKNDTEKKLLDLKHK